MRQVNIIALEQFIDYSRISKLFFYEAASHNQAKKRALINKRYHAFKIHFSVIADYVPIFF